MKEIKCKVRAGDSPTRREVEKTEKTEKTDNQTDEGRHSILKKAASKNHNNGAANQSRFVDRRSPRRRKQRNRNSDGKEDNATSVEERTEAVSRKQETANRKQSIEQWLT